jgi:WD40 repeat protein
VAFSPDGKRLAAGGADADGKGLIEIWNVEAALQNQPQQPVTLAGHSQLIRTIAFSPDGKRLASGGRDNVIIVWRVP